MQPKHQNYVRDRLFCKCTAKPTRGQPAPGVVSAKSAARVFDALDDDHHVFKTGNDNNDSFNTEPIVPTCKHCGGHVLLKSR
jgi:hypothetical protein